MSTGMGSSEWYCPICGPVWGTCDGMDGSMMQQCPAEEEEEMDQVHEILIEEAAVLNAELSILRRDNAEQLVLIKSLRDSLVDALGFTEEQQDRIVKLEAELKKTYARSRDSKMNEHAKNLRRTRADMLGTDDEAHYWECHKAATYIEQLEGIIYRKTIQRRRQEERNDACKMATEIEELRDALKDIVAADHCIGGDYCPHCIAREALEDKDE